ncbi:MAG: insulinase family protein [Planctomycetaceae bacterium]|nr:insulinase family protein [Planctomycetaceae bacterium]
MYRHYFDNGLVLLAEPMNWMESVSYSLLVPYGPVLDPPELAGLASLNCEMMLRGAGQRNSRQFLQALENLGCETSEMTAHLHTGFGASMLADYLLPSLELLADQIRRPHFPEDQLETAKQVVKQDIFSLEDDPPRRVMLELQHHFLPDPWGRSHLGTPESIDRIVIEDIRRQHARFFQPEGTILSVAGKLDWNALREKVEELFADWKPQPFTLPEEKKGGSQLVHLPCDSLQTHIGVAFPCAPIRSPDYMLAWSGAGILSGGMSCRLFNEIREKRGLCYNVYASYSTLRDYAGIYCYCGTGAERAQESLDVLLAELNRLRFGIDEGELDRLKIRAKSTLLMQQESTGSRSGMMAQDWYHLGRVRTLNEIESAINSLTKQAINNYFATHPPSKFHVVTMGTEPLYI